MTDRAAALDVTPSTAERMYDRLLCKGLIRRHRARADRRAVQVSITAAGREVADQATARRRALIAGILGSLAARQHPAVASASGRPPVGQRGRVGSARFPWVGLGFFVVIPGSGGLIYGPLIYRYAREARGHGVPEVMIAVAEEGGRIRPQVAAVKSVASALCIGVGGSVGREGPIVQIGSALASSLGQWVKMPESRMRILVACGAAGGIAAPVHAPVPRGFFGVGVLLRECLLRPLVTLLLAAG